MSDPMTPRGLDALIPTRLRLTDADLVAVAADPHRLGESPTEAAERRMRATETRRRLWRQRVPKRFYDADLADLTAEQDPDGLIARWLDSDVATLVLRAEQTGVGKTHAAYAVGNEAVTRGQWAAAWDMVTFNEALRPGNDPAAYEVACECDLLVLDDLGRERLTEWTLERLTGVVNARWSNGRRTVLTTNLPGDVFVARYGEPVVDRIQDGAWFVLVGGQPRRKPAPW